MRRGRRGGVLTILEILVVLVIITFLFYKMMHNRSKSGSSDQGTQDFLSEQGIDTTSQKAILDSTKKKIQDIGRESAERQSEY